MNFTGLKEELGHSIEIFPNPAATVLNIQGIDDKTSITRLEIVDMRGQLIKTITTGFEVVDIDELRSGMYYLNVYHTSGKVSLPFTKE